MNRSAAATLPMGVVISIATDAGERRALVEVDAAQVCARCAAGRGCGAGVVAGSRSRRVEAAIPDGTSIAPGDTVGLEIAPHSVLSAALIVYGWPMLGAASAAAFAYLGGFDDGPAAIAALSGLVIGALLGRRRLGRQRCLERFTPVIVV